MRVTHKRLSSQGVTVLLNSLRCIVSRENDDWTSWTRAELRAELLAELKSQYLHLHPARLARALETDMQGTSAASLRLLSDLKAISQTPPEGVSASPTSEDNL